MGINLNSEFYLKAKKMLDEYVAGGGNVDNLTKTDQEYMYIKNAYVVDENGKRLTVEQRFELLGHPRKHKYSKDIRADLIKEIEEYLKSGGSFHVNRKKLPFFERLCTYSASLQRQGIFLTHEQIMKEDLGYWEYSEVYYRCKEVEQFSEYRDSEGYVDSYRTNRKFINYIKSLGETYNVPYYFIIAVLCDEKLREYRVHIDKIRYTEQLLRNYLKKHKTFVGMRRKDQYTYDAFDYLITNYSDGSGYKFTKQDWLEVFGLGDVDNRFLTPNDYQADIGKIITKIKEKNPTGFVCIDDIGRRDYLQIVKKSIALNVSVAEIFAMYGLKHRSSPMARFSRVILDKIPYLDEIKIRRDELIQENITQQLKYKSELNKSGKNFPLTLSKEEMFEVRMKAVQQVYIEYEDKLLAYLPQETVLYGSEGETVNV